MSKSEKTITQLVDEIAKIRDCKRDEAHDYMIRVAHGRLKALLTWRKSHDAPKARKVSKPKARKVSKPKARKVSKPKARKVSKPAMPVAAVAVVA